jgi:hypothetical protein
VLVEIEGAAPSEQEKISWLGELVRNWHLSDRDPG